MRTLKKHASALLLLGVASTGLTLGITATTAAPADAAARITVRNDEGTATADTRYRTKLTIDAAGFQSVRGGFGGVYLMFGWVKDPGGGSWKPSRGGVTGEDYRYIPDAEDDSNQGYLKFIAFPGGSTAGEAHAVMSQSGSFSVDLTVPGPRFQAVDREGDLQQVDCTEVTCGIITIGAHGVTNPANETFTPVRFTEVYGTAPQAQETQAAETAPGAGPSTEDPAATATPDRSSTTPKRTAKAAVTVDRATAAAGHAMTFTGNGFTPGEQVVGVLDDGVAAIGPMLAGQSGEVAGVLQLPADLAPGTHELRLTGAASGAQVSERFAVRAGDPAESAEATTEPVAAGDEGVDGSRIFLVAAVAVFAVALGAFALRLAGRRRKVTGSAPAGASR